MAHRTWLEVDVDDWRAWANRGREALIARQANLPRAQAAWRFQVDQDEGVFRFVDADGEPTVTAKMAFYGSRSQVSESWFWAWADPTLDTDPRVEALIEAGETHQLAQLTEARVPCTEQEAEEIFGVCVLLTEPDGWYRFPTRTGMLYLGLWDIEVHPEMEPVLEEWMARALASEDHPRLVAYERGIRQVFVERESAEILGCVDLRSVVGMPVVVGLPVGPTLLQQERFQAIAAASGLPRVRLSALIVVLKESLVEELEAKGTARWPGIGVFTSGSDPEGRVGFTPEGWLLGR